MRAISILFIVILGTFACEEKKTPIYRTDNFWVYIVGTNQSQNYRNAIAQSCSQPNAVNALGDSSLNYYCTTNKVSDGAIYDANTGAKITTDTVSAGASFKCQCPISGRGVGAIYWSRTDNSNVGKNNPTLAPIYVYNASTNPNQFLIYQNGYNAVDNIYCFAACLDQNGYYTNDLSLTYYQILKIR